MPEPHLDPGKRHDFVLLFDVADGNPNGDPDAGNLPRVDPETMQGLVTDVAIKRKVRDYIALRKVDAKGAPANGYRIYVQNKGMALNTLHQEAYTAKSLKSTGAKQKRDDVAKAQSWMCQEFADIRLFGAVMTTEVNAGQVRGPFQLTFARSIDPIVPIDVSITRVAVTNPKDAEVAEGEDGAAEGKGKRTEMGRKPLVPYGLYRGHGFYNPHFGAATGATRDDLALFWEALTRMWDLDRSAARGLMACRGVHVFTHENPLGNAPAHVLLEKVQASRRGANKAARSFEDYEVSVEKSLPAGVTYTQLAWG